MTREELKAHCEKQMEMCEMWAISEGEKPSGKVYEEHKLMLELLEQEPCEDAISREKAKQFLYERLDRLNDNELYDIFSRIIDDMYNELPSVKPATDNNVLTCEDCVSRQAVLNTLFLKSDNNCEVVLNKELQDRIKALPPVTPQQKTGHWIDKDEKSAVCSCCNRNNTLYGDFCKWCGAKMTESEDKNEVGNILL